MEENRGFGLQPSPMPLHQLWRELKKDILNGFHQDQCSLIELTFQRNWNGLIWMSRKGVIAKRVKTAPDGSIENQRRTADGWPRNECSALGQKTIRPVSAKVNRPSSADHITTRETCPAVGQATTTKAAHDHAARAGKQRLAARTPLTYHGRCIRPSREDVPRPAEIIGQIFTRRPRRPTTNHPATTVPTPTQTRLSGRPSRPTVRTPRSTRSRF
ncbi:unnamed protein product [Microthlaspi erraticum]|uniref:Uncharacterized protein n=1 Tax=Microthlaspi erraticum TaxID=1685480 RepID=A0A6D2L1A2_9BRAS|nr:unnamed protein product [Microthlaspi erraticum]